MDLYPFRRTEEVRGGGAPTHVVSRRRRFGRQGKFSLDGGDIVCFLPAASARRQLTPKARTDGEAPQYRAASSSTLPLFPLRPLRTARMLPGRRDGDRGGQLAVGSCCVFDSSVAADSPSLSATGGGDDAGVSCVRPRKEEGATQKVEGRESAEWGRRRKQKKAAANESKTSSTFGDCSFTRPPQLPRRLLRCCSQHITGEETSSRTTRRSRRSSRRRSPVKQQLQRRKLEQPGGSSRRRRGIGSGCSSRCGSSTLLERHGDGSNNSPEKKGSSCCGSRGSRGN